MQWSLELHLIAGFIAGAALIGASLALAATYLSWPSDPSSSAEAAA